RVRELAERVAAAMSEIPGVVDSEISLGEPRPEYRIEVNRDLANELALDVGHISSTVRPLLAGQTATTWEDPTGEERDVVVQLATEQRTSIEDLLTLPIATGLRTEAGAAVTVPRSEEHTSELQSRENLVCRLLLEKKKTD